MNQAVSDVLVFFKCHFDIGFTETEEACLARYFGQHIPRAIDVAAQLRREGEDRYVWTLPAWTLYRYLEQADAAARARTDAAIAAGDLAWHALPFTWYTELLDRSMIAAAIGFSNRLDARYGVTTTAARLTDVPGHTRGIIGPLADAGIDFLDSGVNHGSTAPQVPFIPRPGRRRRDLLGHRQAGQPPAGGPLAVVHAGRARAPWLAAREDRPVDRPARRRPRRRPLPRP
jgi:hypothetical protein